MKSLDLNDYIESHGLRILCRAAFGYFYNRLGDYPGNYLEIGVFEGFTLRELSYKYQDKMFYGVDPFIEDGYTTGHTGTPKGDRLFAQMAKTYQNIIGRPNIVFYEQTSRSWGEELTDKRIEQMNISAVLVDGDHSFEEAYNDMWIALRCLKNGGIIFVDDQGLSQVKEATKEFVKEYWNRINSYSGTFIRIK